MEKEPFIMRMTKWSWTPIILGVVVCFGTIALVPGNGVEAVFAGVGIVCFGWIAMIKGFSS